MRTYKVRIYTNNGYFTEEFQADDYWDADRRVKARYPNCTYNGLTEI